MAERIGWGFMGTGNIARQFATGLKTSQRGIAVAAGSRSVDTAGAFCRQFEIPSAYGSYDELLRDPQVDAIYLSLPNSMHHEWTIKSLRAGKHVLCEKPISVSSKEAVEMF